MSTEDNEDDPFSHRTKASDLERIKQARKNRVLQLKSWYQYDKNMEKQKARAGKITKLNHFTRNVHFPQSMVLLEAAGREDHEEVKRLLTDGASPDVCNEDGLTALHQSCIDNSLIICQLLLQFGANVNATDSELWTPLHAAAACAHAEICASLIDQGANLLALNAEGNMPYDICEEENTLDLIENAMAARGVSQEEIDEKRKEPELKMLYDIQDLKSKNGNLSLIDEQGASLLHIAASCGYLDVGRYLLDHGVFVDILDKDGWEAIHVAACWGQLEFIELLMIRGANIDSTTNAGETVYEICEDPEINKKLHHLKQEFDRKLELKKSLQVRPSLSTIGRRSTSSKRSASIRRSSMREKSLMSWKEARQEALIREVVEKKITTPKTDSGNEIGSPSPNERIKSMEKDKIEEIDMNQVMLDVQAFSHKEPFVRQGSNRNSFTHSHPYHSPTRDLTLLEEPLKEETVADINGHVEQKVEQKPVPAVRSSQKKKVTHKTDSSQSETDASYKPNPIYSDPNFVRSSDSNRSNRHDRSHSANLSQREKKRREIEHTAPLVKPQKTQGCCLMM